MAGGRGGGGGNCFFSVYTSYHSFSWFFSVFLCFLMVLSGFRWFWKGLGGFGRVWEGWGRVGRGGEGSCYLRGGIFYIFFSGFAIDRSKKYIKTIKNHMKIDAVDPQAAADNPPPPPGNNGEVSGPLQPRKTPKTRQIVRCLRMLTQRRAR